MKNNNIYNKKINKIFKITNNNSNKWTASFKMTQNNSKFKIF